MSTSLEQPPGMSDTEYEAIKAYAAKVAAAAPPPTPELIAKLRAVFASTYDDQADVA